MLFGQGVIDGQVQFYMFFMAPIQIARAYRLTQEITPAGTIISINMVIGVLGGTFIHKLLFQTDYANLSNTILRLTAIAFLIFSLALITKVAIKEMRTSRSTQSLNVTNNNSRSTTVSSGHLSYSSDINLEHMGQSNAINEVHPTSNSQVNSFDSRMFSFV